MVITRIGMGWISRGLLASAMLVMVSCSQGTSPVAAVARVDTNVPPARYCARSAEKTATDVAGLKTWLMVIALTCKAQRKYNTFVTGQRSSLAAHETALTAYFRRNYGKQATAVHDDYITQLANMLSAQSLQQGTAFCAANVAALDKVMSVRGVDALGNFATAHPAAQPERFEVCK